MPTTLQRTRDDREHSLRQCLETMAQAIRDKDIDALMSHYTPDVVVYDVRPPLDVHGAAAYRKNFERWFSSILGPIDYTVVDQQVSMSESHAFCFSLARVKGARLDGDTADYWVRVTTCLQKTNGQWRVGHEHVSMPSA